MYAKYIKRLLDIVCSFLGMVLFSWLFGIIALLVKVKLGSPVIYKAKRPGIIDPSTGKEKIFQLYKFRSMTNETDENGKLLPDTQRLTKFGRMLRATSLDELPEIFNIFKGDMSIVGPRPLAVSYLNYYTDEEHHRHDVRPGLTGLAQVSGRNSLSWEEKFALDLKYIKEISFLKDIGILIQTVVKVFKREGIGQGEEAPVSLSVERKERLGVN
ncbi:MAG: sugar transferase [Lachnospiraceae bacterium]|nr:sugar transferase [Lachnospiraceae bacterium]